MQNEFDFLTDLEQDLTAPDKTPREKMIYPIEGDFRIKRNGTIIFSDNFRKRCAILDKKGKDTGEIKWIDFVFTTDWAQYSKDKPSLCLINIIEPITSESGKVDKGAKADVKKETKVTYIKDTFIPKAEILWGFSMEDRAFIDFTINEFVLSIKKASIPKVVSSGDAKGEPTYTLRENLKLSPIKPNLLEETEQGVTEFEEENDRVDEQLDNIQN